MIFLLSTVQYDTVSGIVSGYDKYVVYYYADYHNYTVGEERDSRIEIYVGSDITFEDNTFFFGDDVECYYFTNSKYLSLHNRSSEFKVKDSEIVYTNCNSVYPEMCYLESQFNSIKNFDFMPFVLYSLLLILAFSAVIRIVLGGAFK